MTADERQPPEQPTDVPPDRQGSGPAGDAAGRDLPTQELPAEGSLNHDPLDVLLAAARWPEPSPASRERLRTFWRSVSPAHRRGRFVSPLPRWAAAAAVVALAVGVAWLVWAWQRPGGGPKTVSPDGPTPPAPLSTENGATKVDRRAPRSPVLTPRAPTHREKLAMAGAEVQYRAKQQRSRLIERVDAAVAGVAADPVADVALVTADLKKSVPADVVTSRLIATARGGTPSARPAAARLLAELRLPATLPVLLELARDTGLKGAVYPAILRLADDATLERLARAETDPPHRRQLLAALLGRGKPAATVLYLRRVADAHTADAALDALDDLQGPPPVDALFAQLGSADANLRYAAAKVLGRINGPTVARRLADLVERDTHRREALAALMFSRGKEAQRFLQAARQHPELAAAIASAEVRTGRSF